MELSRKPNGFRTISPLRVVFQFYMMFKRRNLLRCETSGQIGHDLPLKRIAHLKNVAGFFKRRIGDKCAAVGLEFKQTLDC